METKDIISLIKKHKEEIFNKFKNKKFFNDYNCILTEFKTGNVVNNDKFKKVYRKFYVLNRGGLGEKLIDRYFELLQRGETDIKKVLIELSKIPRLNGKPVVLLSFASKLIHTVDNNQPIYDSRVAKIFNIKLDYNIRDINERIDDRVAVYNLLKKKFNKIFASQEIKEIIKDFKERLGVEIGDVKMLDFILWQLGDIKQKI
ncbi:MAG: hypothetical protein ACPLXC_01015 [Candidatus Pacearchaeota archaeon]